MRETCQHVAVVVAVAVVVLFTNLGGPRLWDRDEPRNAGCALEMMQRGDWVVPWFNDELRTHKPVLLYWLIMSAYSVLGVNEFSARFWSAALGVGTALCTYAIGRRLFHPRIGLLAAVILVTTLMFDVASHAATPDSPLIFFVTAAIALFVVGMFPGDATTPVRLSIPWPTALGVYSLMGFAVLAKGPVGLVLPTAVLGMYMLLARLPAESPTTASTGPNGERRWLRRAIGALRPFAPRHFLATCWAMRPITAIVCCLAIAAPWYVEVGRRSEGEWLRGFFLEHNLARATQTFEGHRGPALLFYPLTLLAGFFPWSVFFVPSLLELVSQVRRRAEGAGGYVFCACWAGVWIGAFSLAKTKLPSYITPCYPAVAIATAAFLHAWIEGTDSVRRLWPRLALGIFASVGAAVLLLLPLAAGHFLPGEQWLGAIGLIPLLGGLTAMILAERKQRRGAAWAFAVAAIALTTGVFGYATLRVDQHQQNHLLLEAIARRGADVEVGSLGVLEPTWVFYGRRPVRELYWSPAPAQASAESVAAASRAAAHEAAAPARWGVKSKAELGEFLAGGANRAVITTRQHWTILQPVLPADTTVLAAAPLFLKNKELVVLARSGASQQLARPPSDTPRR